MELILPTELLKFVPFSHVHSDIILCTQVFNMAPKMSWCSNVSGIELFAVTIRFKGKFNLITIYHVLL